MTQQPDDRSAKQLSGMPVLRFCARCRKSFENDLHRLTCSICGYELLPQGYCPVCENTWPLSPGEACPKHDVPLEPQPESGEDREAERPSNWAVAATFGNDTEAEAMRLRLEAEGISTFMENVRMGSGSMFQVATGGTALKVPVDRLADARVILDQDWTIPAGDDQIDNDDDWAGLDAEAGFESPSPDHEGGYLVHGRPFAACICGRDHCRRCSATPRTHGARPGLIAALTLLMGRAR